MIQRKLWNIKQINRDLQHKLAQELKISPTLAQLLINRGFKDAKRAQDFLNPSFTSMSSPFVIGSMEIAVDKIRDAILHKKKIMIFGDYDVDGITSTSLLTEVLRSLDANVDYYIPDRIEEGYGLNLEALTAMLQDGVELIITVDCGISARDEIIAGQELGLEFVVTDHHQPPEKLPPCIIVNPALEEDWSPWKELAGVGVAFKLAQGLLEKMRGTVCGSTEILKYLDLAALGTIADIVPLHGDNRIIVKNGLEQISLGRRLGIKALCHVAGVDYKNISSGQVAFGLAPRLNACGRIGDANLGVKLLLASSEIEAQEIAEKLNIENQNRQAIEAEITNEAEKIVEKVDLEQEKVIIITSDTWHPGVIGIVASRLVEKYYRPTIVLTQQNGVYKGSGRSIPGFHLQKALTQCQELLESFGGHSQAAGLSLLVENIEAFRQKINNIAQESFNTENLMPLLDLDGEINLAEVDFKLYEELSKLEPTGFLNPEPRLVYRRSQVLDSRTVGSSGGHLKLKVKASNTYFDAIGFNMANYLEIAAANEPIDLAFALDKNTWNGKTTLQLILKDIKSYKEVDNPLKRPGFLERLFLDGQEYLEDDGYKNINLKEAFYTKVVGVTFEERQVVISSLAKDDEIKLVREPDNVHDPNAIAVFTRCSKIGYLKKEIAKHLAINIDNGVHYSGFITQITGGNEGNLGINIYLKKMEPDDAQNTSDFKQNRNQLSSLNTGDLLEKIQNAIIGKYEYRPKQLETLNLLEEGYNTLAILGTGRGKSAIFQTRAAYLALAQKKMTIIIYPLRSLVNDQYLSLKNKLSPLGLNIFKAIGSLENDERLEFFAMLEKEEIDIILTTPEFLAYNRNKFSSIINKIGLIVVDESHHLASRRGGYKLIENTISYLGNPQVLAVTATADDNTGKIICDKLNIEKLVIDPHIRENLKLIDSRNCHDKIGYIKKLLLTGERTVVYVNSRKKAYSVAADLRRDLPHLKDTIGYYHGGLKSDDRQGIENLFREGALQLIVTTSAFGEGIDIPDIENVVLYHLCFSKEEYNQLAGRAGRNGATAKVHLIYGNKDKELNQLLLAGNCPDRQQLSQFYVLLKKLSEKNTIITLTNDELAEWAKIYKIFGVQEKNITVWLSIFEELGLLERELHGNKRRITLTPNPSKVDLENSIRYLEGLEERYDFDEYVEMAFKFNSDALLKLINKPIYPNEVIKM